jgi:hypothetical protein
MLNAPPKSLAATCSSDRASGTKNTKTKDPETEALAEEKDSETIVEDWNFVELDDDDDLAKAVTYAADALGVESYCNSAATLIQK